MFKRVQLEPENKTFAEIMSNGKTYSIPPFQRDYNWKEEQLTELWEDIHNMLEYKAQHFMGYIVLKSQDGKQFKIIDGQQRLTTLIIITLAVLNRFQALVDNNQKKEHNEKRKQQIHDTYLGVFDTVTLTTAPKLTLNRNNQNHFQEIITNNYSVPKQHGITATNRLLNKALQFFQAKMATYHAGEELAALLQHIADGLVFTTITVQDEINAYLVFETLNARGVHLSSPDLLKNYLLSVFSQKATTEQLQQVEIDWSTMIEQLGETNCTAFLRSYHGMQDKLKHKKELYRYIKEKIDVADKVGEYIRDIKKFASIYSALQNPDSAFWRDYGDGRYTGCTAALETLALFRIKTPLSLLMIAYDKLDPPQFVRLVKWIEIITIRYNVICSKNPSEQETTYNQLAIRVFIDDIEPNRIKEALVNKVYPADEEFVTAFSHKDMASRQSPGKIVFLLRKIETHLSGGQEPTENLSLEHVLPHKPTDDWQVSFGRSSYAEAIERLGNMALLPANQNRDLDQADFQTKKQVLVDSNLAINKKISEHEQWNMENLNKHQKWLAKQAKTVWRMD